MAVGQATLVWPAALELAIFMLFHFFYQKGDPEFKAGLFTEYGKWMDGWETRRKRIPGKTQRDVLKFDPLLYGQ